MPDGFEGIQDHNRKVQELAVAQFYREFLEKRNISQALADAANLRVDVANNLNRQLEEDTKAGKKHPWLAPNEYGVYIPFLDLHGDPIPGVYAIRRSGPEMPKYITPGGGRGVYAYLPPIYDWNEIARDVKYKIVIVEGPPKALTIMRYLPQDTVVIAIPGVTMWDVASNMSQVPRLLEKFVWAGRDVAVLFDRDTKEKAKVNVLRARERIVDVLLKLHANAHVIDLPDDGSPKTGPDDYLVAGGRWEDLVWQPQDIQTHPVRMLRSQTMVINNPVSVIDVETMVVMSYQNWKILHRNKFMLVPNPNKPTEPPKKVFATDVIWDDPDRNEVHSIDFQPGKPANEVYEDSGVRKLNTWQGFKPISTTANPQAWEKFLQFVRHVVPDEGEARWLLQFLAHTFQHPGERPQHMVILQSVMTGTGKSTIARVWTTALGIYGQKVRSREFFGGYNKFMYQNLGLWVDELKDGEHKQSQIVEILKDLVTSPQILVSEKYVPAFPASLFSRILATTNDLSALKISLTERRINILQCNESHLDNDQQAKLLAVYLNNMCSQDRADDLQGIVEGFMSFDLEGYDPAARSMQNDAMHQAQEFSKWSVEEATDVVLDRLREMVEEDGADGIWVDNAWLQGLYLTAAQFEGDKYTNLPKTLVTRAREMGNAASSEIVKKDGRVTRGQWISFVGVAFKATDRKLKVDGTGKKYS